MQHRCTHPLEIPPDALQHRHTSVESGELFLDNGDDTLLLSGWRKPQWNGLDCFTGDLGKGGAAGTSPHLSGSVVHIPIEIVRADLGRWDETLNPWFVHTERSAIAT